MDIQIPTLLLDGVVLMLVSQEDRYGYILTQKVQENFPISESTLYPVLRRLKKDGALETHDEPFEGRMRRYYRITASGKQQLQKISSDWEIFKTIMDETLGGQIL
ncbi:MAG: PadR family transcriptional regulator [Streptococcaceae bacterium]|jgi:PadR family transcriptional regulator PadR|nr:PadR family transcriptional regulator [Streptococcaceae bacterium]